jgi:pseudaminic acid biosynthesis-associated methylase
MENYKTEQEEFWAGPFGDDYSQRNQGIGWVASNIALFKKIFSHTQSVGSVIEFGANTGLNLCAIKNIFPEMKLSAVEINNKAVGELDKLGEIKVYQQSILDFHESAHWDFALIKGVLIHIDPDFLPRVYEKLFKASKRYICVAEYYNPSPMEVEYRGHQGKLYKRDFAGEILDKFRGVRLVDYGFVYHRDCFPQDDITWFLLEKK